MVFDLPPFPQSAVFTFRGNPVHPRVFDADRMSQEAIGAAIEVHHILGPGLMESIYEKCLRQELERRGITVVTQEHVRIEY